MKKTLLSLTVAFATGITTLNAQNVNIPDANLKSQLVGNTQINTNSDTEIQVSEAVAFTGAINLGFGPTDLTGIEAFVNITQLDCSNLGLTTVDISQNTSLLNFMCSGNQLTNIDISTNTSLYYFNCSNNLLTSVNVSQNTALGEFECSSNQLTNLDVSLNSALTYLKCDNNLLVSLNVANGNNTNWGGLETIGNSNLNCIQIDDADTTGYNWSGTYFNFNPGVTFSNNCGSTTGISATAPVNKIIIYPNPTAGLINFDVLSNVQVTSLTGQIIADKKNVYNLNIADQPTGIYFLTLTDINGQVIQRTKIVKD